MKGFIKNISIVLLFVLAVSVARANFSSLYVFGDALSATADKIPPAPASFYYQNHDSNGRVWVEVLAQRQGLTFDTTKNDSYYDHNSAALLSDVNNFQAPPDVANDLFIVWVCNADTFDAAQAPDNAAQWQAAIKQSQANHLQIITNLYAIGVRTLILPNAVDISEIPAFNAGTTLTSVEHNGCIAYNVAFSNTINQAMALCPGLTIYAPDYFTLLNNVLTNASAYGLTNALKNGFSIDALTALYAKPPAILNGPGTNYIFWDNADPTAKLHEIMADVAQQIISPAQINGLALFNGSNRLDAVNVPVGLSGFVDGCTNLSLANWTTVTNIASSNTAQSFFVSASPLPVSAASSGNSGGSTGSGGIGDPGGGTGTNNVPLNSAAQFYRLRFPYSWTWP